MYCICHFDLETKKVKRPVANTNHQHDVIYYRNYEPLTYHNCI